MTETARREIVERLIRQAPYPGEKVIYQPVELEECFRWRVLRPDSGARAEIMTRVVRDFGLPDRGLADRSTYLDVGCNTGFFCHHLRRLGFYSEGVDVTEADIAVARLLDSFFRKDNNTYVVADAFEYLSKTEDHLFDVTSAFSLVQWVMVQKTIDHGIACLERLFSKTRRVCFLEVGYSSEPHYRGVMPPEIDRAWVRKMMEEKGGFSKILVFDAGENGLMRDLFVGFRTGRTRVMGGDVLGERRAAEPEACGGMSLAAEMESGWAPARGEHAEALAYRKLVAKIRALVGLLLPSDSTVVVMSRGDEDLVNLDGRRGWHFPVTNDGTYAGHYPADSNEAIAQLERLRAKGAEFLVVPRPALWWLDHYEGFRTHLERRYRVLVSDENTCAIFALGDPPATAEASRLQASWDQASSTILNCLKKEHYGDKIAMLLTKILPHYVKPGLYRKYFRLWEEHGCHVTPVNYYQPIPDTRELSEQLWATESELVGIDLNEDLQLHLLRDAFPRFRAEYDEFPFGPAGQLYEFHFNNGMFDGTDALVLYCMVRHFQPTVIIEVGSGYSSRVSAQAALRNGHTRLVCIEPHPRPELVDGFPGLSALIPKRVQDVEVDFFEELGPDDILFIDSSHVMKCGSDVNYLFLEVLPRLRPGVLVHIHDIFLPGEYRRDWVKDELRFWNEQYLLQAFLTFNSAYEVVLSNNYLGHKHQDQMRATFPRSPWWGGGSFWMRRKATL